MTLARNTVAKKELSITKLQRENEMMRFAHDERSHKLMFVEQDSASAVNKHIEESLASLACLQASYEIKLQENK